MMDKWFAGALVAIEREPAPVDLLFQTVTTESLAGFDFPELLDQAVRISHSVDTAQVAVTVNLYKLAVVEDAAVAVLMATERQKTRPFNVESFIYLIS
jgi:hypothetical protein